MKKPHILFVTEKHADCNPNGSLTNSFHNLFGSLECSELATHSNFFFEEHLNRMDDDLIETHKNLKPDFTVITLLAGWGNNPTNRAFADMASRSPLIFVWFDVAHKFIMDMARSVEPYSSANIVLDNPYIIPNDKYTVLWTPQDTRIYTDPCVKRDIDVSFIGSIQGYPDRNDHLNHIISRCGANIQQHGGQREHNLPPQRYATYMQRSKISLNFSKTRNGLQQTKGRLWEVTLCGALLMEDYNLGTHKWFDPMKDYVPFSSPDDLLDKIDYYLNNPDKASEIASAGRKKSSLHYSPKNWWRIVLSKASPNFQLML